MSPVIAEIEAWMETLPVGKRLRRHGTFGDLLHVRGVVDGHLVVRRWARKWGGFWDYEILRPTQLVSMYAKDLGVKAEGGAT